MTAEEYRLQFNRWLYLMNAFRALRLQGEITVELEEDLTETLTFSHPALIQFRITSPTRP